MVSEDGGSVEVCVIREGDVSGSLTIQVTTEEFNPPQAEGIGTQKIGLECSLLSFQFFIYTHHMIYFFISAGVDYIDLHPELQILSFEPNENRTCFNINILDDQLSEGVENFYGTIVSVPTGVTIGTPDTTVISIMDDEST